MAELNKARKMLADMFIKALEENELEWKKGWQTIGGEAPVNAVANNKYRCINRMLLSFVAMQNGWEDNRWCTFKQAQKKGWTIIKGSKGTPVEYWNLYDKLTEKNYSFREAEKIIREDPEREKDFVMVSKTFTVFNAAQIDGIPKLPEVEKKYDIKLNDFVENVAKNMDIAVVPGGNRACYVPSDDIIRMPPKERFVDDYKYNSTLLHELSHATGHSSRLNRPIQNRFGTEDYAKEELRAEISSCFLTSALPIVYSDEHLNNHKAYVQSWIKAIKDDKNELFKAIKDANNIADYIMEKGEIEKFLTQEEIIAEKEQPDIVSAEDINNFNDILEQMREKEDVEKKISMSL